MIISLLNLLFFLPGICCVRDTQQIRTNMKCNNFAGLRAVYAPGVYFLYDLLYNICAVLFRIFRRDRNEENRVRCFVYLPADESVRGLRRNRG